jgi:hypothetical protein
MNVRSKTNIRFNGREYANADEMPPDIRAAYDRAVDDTPPLHSGARIAAKLKAKIIVNGNEFNHPGELSVDDRHSLHEALEALYELRAPVSSDFTDAVSTGEARLKPGRKKFVLVAIAGITVLLPAVYLVLRAWLG